MVTSINWTDKAIADITLKSVYQQMNLNNQSDITLIIRLLENPSSPITLPGKISLHIIVELGVSLTEEAFLIGFTMGNDDRTKIWHIRLFKFIARFVYPSKYRFDHQHLNIFDLGFKYGKILKSRNIHQIEFAHFYDLTIEELRDLFDIDDLSNPQ